MHPAHRIGTTVSSETIAAFNRDLVKLALAEPRLEAVRSEVEQLASAIQAVRHRLTFDTEPADFAAAMHECRTAGVS